MTGWPVRRFFVVLLMASRKMLEYCLRLSDCVLGGMLGRLMNNLEIMMKTVVVLWFKVPALEGVRETMNGLSTG